MQGLSLSSILPEVQQRMEVQAQKARYLHDPVLWVEDYLGMRVWSRQKEVLYSIRDNKNTAVVAGHGLGKSILASLAIAWWVDVHPPEKTFVASTAPFSDQITAILWLNLRRIHQLAQQRFEQGLVDHPLPGYITGDNKWKTPLGLLIGQGRKPPDSRTDSGFQGLHAEFLLAIGDEAAGLNQDMVNALGNITTGEQNRLLLIANPTDPTSALAKIWTNNLSSWVRMHISVLDSPLITKEDGWEAFKDVGMSGQGYVDKMREEWGEDHSEYKIRVLGQWAFERGNNVFTDVDIARGVNCLVQPVENEFYLQIGADIARGDMDFTELYRCERGMVWSTDPETNKPVESTGRMGWRIRYVNSWKNVELSWDDPQNPGTAQRIDAHARAIGARVVSVDAAGMGVAVTNPLVHLSRNHADYAVAEVWGSKPPLDRRAFVNIRAEVIFALQAAMARGDVDIDGNDEGLIEQMRTVVFEYTDKGQKKIESKDSMKNRGVKSPDKVDAMWYSFWDTSALLNPNQNMRPGDRMLVDSDEYIDEFSFDGAGMPQ